MNGGIINEEMIYYIAVAIIVVGSAVVVLLIRRKRKTIKPTNLTTEPLLKQTRYHRCPNTKCGALISEDELYHEFNHTTKPTSEYIICPKCKGRMFSTVEGKLKIPAPDATIKTVTPSGTTKKYDLVVDEKVVKDLLKLFNERGLKPVVNIENEEWRIQFESDRSYKFDTLVSKGWVKNVKTE